MAKKIDKSGSIEKLQLSKQDFKSRFSQKVSEFNKTIDKKPRELSNCVVSRWYRAPEIILTQKRYD
jgi:hypothetical protein